jgi:hypothetical protein
MTTNIQSFAGDVQIDSGNLSVKSLEVKDGVTKLGSNNTTYSNVGVMMTRKDGASNVAFLFTEDGANVVLGYTNDDALEGDRIDILSDETANLVVYGNVYVSGSVHGDGSTLTGLVTTLQSVSEFGSETDQTILFTNEITGINVSSNVLVSGNVTANVYFGDGGLLSNITQTLEGITAIGNTTTYTLEFNNTHTSFVTVSNVGIGNALPTADLCVGANVVIDDASLDKISVTGNVNCHQLNLGSIEILPAYSLENVTQIANTTTNTISFNHSTLAFDTQKMAGIGIIPSSADVGVSGLHVDGHLRLGGQADNTDNELMYIKSAGALGVLANESDTNNTNTDLRLQSGETYNSNITMVGKSSAQYMTFGTNTAERMRIDSSGRIGVGATNPGYKLDVHGTSNVGALTATSLFRGVTEVPVRWNSQNETVFPQSATTVYYKLATLGTTGDFSNGGKLRISGTIGGFGEQSTTLIDAFVASRGGISYGGTLTGYGGDPTVVADLVVYQETNGTFAVWIKLIRYFAFDLTLWGGQTTGNTRTINVLPCPTTNTSVATPTGTLEGSIVDACSVVFKDDGNVGIGTTNPTYTLDVAGTSNAATYYQNGVELYAQRRWEVDLTGQSTDNFYPVELKHPSYEGSPDLPDLFPVHFKVFGESLGGDDSYNENTLVGYARGGGWTDHREMYDVHYIRNNSTEKRFEGLYEGTQGYQYGFVIYMRGGYTYSVLTDATKVNTYTSETTLNNSVFAIKDVDGADVSGTSAKINRMVHLAGADEREKRFMSGNLQLTSDLVVNDTVYAKSLVVTGNGQYEPGSIYSDANWGMLFRAKQASPVQGEFLWTDSVGTRIMILDENANLGINTDAPNRRLEVLGNAYVSSNLEVGTANLFVDTQTGNVGIGTTNPQEKFHLYGSPMIQHETRYNVGNSEGWYKLGTWDAPDSSGSRLKISLLGGESYNVASTARGGETIIYASINNNGDASVSNMSGSIHAYGNPVIRQAKFKQVGTDRTKYEIHAYVESYTQHSMKIECTNTTTFTRAWTGSSDPGADSSTVQAALFTHVVNNAGNVGIGTTDPTSDLHITNQGGTFNLGGSLRNQYNSVGVTAASVAAGYNTGSGPTDNGDGSYTWTLGGGDTNGSINLGYTASANEQIKITFTAKTTDTTSPSFQFENPSFITIGGSQTLTASYVTYTIYATLPSNGGGLLFFRVYADNITWNDLTIERDDVFSGGNLGIGVTNPDNELEVRGKIQASYSDTNHGIIIDSGGTIRRDYGGGGAGFHFTSNTIWPTNYLGTYSNGGVNLGDPSYRWATINGVHLNLSGVSSGWRRQVFKDEYTDNVTKSWAKIATVPGGSGILRIHGVIGGHARNTPGEGHVTLDIMFSSRSGFDKKGFAHGRLPSTGGLNLVAYGTNGGGEVGDTADIFLVKQNYSAYNITCEAVHGVTIESSLSWTTTGPSGYVSGKIWDLTDYLSSWQTAILGTSRTFGNFYLEGSSTQPIVKVADTAATSSYNYIINGHRPGTNTGGAVHFINGSTRTADGGANTYTIRNDSGDLNLGKVSSNTHVLGAVHINKVGFAAYASTGGDTSTTSVFIGDTEYYDLGGNYSTTTGKFTAPVKGIYKFGWNSFINQSATTASRIFMYKNSTIYTQKGGTIDRMGNEMTATVELDVNDTFDVRGASSYALYYYAAGGHNIFYGHLLTAT